MTAAAMIPAAPGWRAALFSNFFVALLRGKGDLSDADAAMELDLLDVIEIAPVLPWVHAADPSWLCRIAVRSRFRRGELTCLRTIHICANGAVPAALHASACCLR